MLWFVFALLAPLTWAISNVIDSYFVSRRSKTPYGLIAITGLFGGLPVLFVLLHGSTLLAAPWLMGIGFLTGVVSLAVYLPYYKALESIHPATADLLWNLSPALVVMFAWLFLHERLSGLQYLAIVLLMVAVVIATPSKVHKTVVNFPAVLWMILAAHLTAAQSLLEKWLLQRLPLDTEIALVSAGVLFAGCLLCLMRPARQDMARLIRHHRLDLICVSQLLTLAGCIMTTVALALSSVSLVKTIDCLQPIMVLMLVSGLKRYHKKKRFRFHRAPSIGLSLFATGLVMIGLFMLGVG